METAFAAPYSALSPDDAINGQYYGSAVVPSRAAAADPDQGSGHVSLPIGGNITAVLLWWLILVGLLVFAHVLTLRIQD